MSMDLAVELALALQQQQDGGGGGGNDEDGADATGGEAADETQERIHTVSIRSPEGLPAEVGACSICLHCCCH
jgi:hypothetical protein